ncbi:MAG: urea carboxylase-associated family protein [Alphaproteobacteria bacterium]|nr:urea carboxylase-associated family protein [Alphaproteobacteria bacterium]
MMTTAKPYETVPARQGKAAYVKAGAAITIINTYGTQVVDTWCFMRDDLTEFMSMEHQRSVSQSVFPSVGAPLYSNRRRPILTLEEDTSPGRHDTLLAACDVYRYQMLGCTEYHDNCTDNLAAAMTEIGLAAPETPSPLNLWMNIPFTSDGATEFCPPLSKPEDFVRLRANHDVIVVMSTCPQDMVPINGADMIVRPVHYHIE